MKHRLAHMLSVVALIVSATTPLDAIEQQMDGRTLIAALRQGGYVIVMRHSTTEAKPDSPNVDLANCATQRNLSAEGRVLARSIGNAIDALRVPIGRVTSSPFCRAEDTAGLAFGHYGTDTALAERPVKNAATFAQAAAALRPLIASSAMPAANVVLVTHAFNVKSVVGDDVVEGEAAVFKPDAKGGFTLVARMRPQDWENVKS